MNGFLFVVRKEVLHLRRDATSLVIALLLPLFQLLVFGFAIDFDVRHIGAVVVDQDRSRESRAYIASLRNTQYLDPDTEVATAEEAAKLIQNGRARVAVVIPPNFGREVAAGRSPQVGVLLDGSDSTVSTRATLAFSAPPQAAVGGRPQARVQVLFNPTGRSQTSIIPGLIGVVIQIVVVSLTSSSIVREKELGTLEQLMVSPIGRLGLMLGKLAPYAVLAMFEFGAVLGGAFFLFDVRVVGSLPGLIVLAIPFVFASLALGLLISTVAKTQAQALQLTLLTMLPSILMSGFVFPQETMPGMLYIASQAIPLTHFLQILRGIIVRGSMVVELLPSTLALTAIAVVLVTIATTRFRKSVE
ncbi:ABC transporter permease [Fimbriimonas ginsengisoli]|uniref:ABC-2 type transporter n=1 Tax=Fimbriimonas ginsengisoli Gsoil 348 TaxID=661478 RepID=A0A068NSE8_FIMGI|nr:ABC transporter permease [Fimbriimonas ginsengisoli]AIE86277.1 ABC-2 type transporter [Fimbriimonas ginsengisoli Gsoil 348]